MKITAIICEYNPFHLGHAYQLQKAAAPDGEKTNAVIAIMSGNFTQRADAAVLSKYQRAEIAVISGADLVLELPFPYSSASAEIFGGAGVRIADALGCVDTLCFGSETGDIDALQKLSARLCSEEYQRALTEYLSRGHELAYRTSGEIVYQNLYGEPFPAEGSNDLLSLSYLTALQKQKSKIEPVTVKRLGERYNGGGEGFASATSIRALLKERDFEKIRRTVPQVTADALEKADREGNLADSEILYTLFAALIRSRGQTLFEGLYDIPEELAARCVKYIYAKNMTEFLSLCGTKRYSPSRIRRAILTALLNVRKEDVVDVPYTLVLAANETGRKVLKTIRKTSSIPVITKPADAVKYGEAAEKAFALSARADSIWELLLANSHEGNRMMKEKPVMV
ncbi:MAG: nucleotidyltransferase family protein [Clostridia bacterium]|nr:nucleotidyltransferase family protein [Clostridia bacterium]